MDWIDYREKLNIGFADETKVQYFITKVFNVLDDIDPNMNTQIDENEYYSFCNMTGTSMEHGFLYGQGFSKIITVLKRHTKSFKEFVSYYIAFVNCQKDNEYKDWTKENFINVLCNMLTQSHIPYEIIKDNDDYFLFPKGAIELDNALVSEPLLWLKKYPLAQKAWIKALKDYSEATELTASETADNFRKALERFFQEFFGGGKSLENYKKEYSDFLRDQNVPAELSGNFQKLLESYTNYINNYAKHHDKTSKNVLEYIMYQTGNIMRLLITLSN